MLVGVSMLVWLVFKVCEVSIKRKYFGASVVVVLFFNRTFFFVICSAKDKQVSVASEAMCFRAKDMYESIAFKNKFFEKI